LTEWVLRKILTLRELTLVQALLFLVDQVIQ